jgi:ribosome-binding factor A
MDSTRLAKVSRQIQKDLNEIFQRQSQSLFQGRMITATIVRVSPDIGVAKVFLSVFPSSKAEETLTIVTENVKTIRHELAQRVKQQFRIVPELIFYIDDSLDYIENIDRLLKK